VLLVSALTFPMSATVLQTSAAAIMRLSIIGFHSDPSDLARVLHACVARTNVEDWVLSMVCSAQTHKEDMGGGCGRRGADSG